MSNYLIKFNLLNKLIDKYERSKLSKEGTNKNYKIFISSSDNIFNKYFGTDSYKYREQIDFELNDLVVNNYIVIEYDYNKELKKVLLNLNEVDNIYLFLNRENRRNLNFEILNEVIKNINNKGITGVFSSFIKEKLESFSSIKSYFSDIEEYKLIVKTINLLENQKDDILKRVFSIKHYNDSKLFEKIENKICRIIKEFSDLKYDNNEELLSYFNIYKNPTFVYLKGSIVIKVNNQIINLKDFGYELSLTSNLINDLEIISINTDSVYTIENLTSFYSFKNEGLLIYLGGYHNTIRRDLLLKLFNFNNKLKWYHFGDIDAGGFNIFIDLVEKTNIPFIPYKMDISTLEIYKNEGKELTKNDIYRLNDFLNNDKYKIFEDVINYMLKNNIKLEQEIID